ncbi:MAG: hypothetical protein M1120_03645 [Patescibacteria group bacterium]|nr:hypothetical protein [Patescibacteria group bacterium]
MPRGLIPQISKLVGAATASSWAQVFAPQTEEDKPQYFLAVSVLSRNETEASILGKEISDNLLSELSGSGLSILENLKSSLNNLQHNALDKDLLVDCALGCLHRGCLYAAVLGRAGFMFSRDNRLAPLLAASENEIQAASGFVREKDIVILSTSGFNRLVSLSTIAANFDHKQMDEVVEALSPNVLGAPDNSLAAALFLQLIREEDPFEKEEAEELPAEEKIEPAPKASLLNSVAKKIKPAWQKVKMPFEKIYLPAWKKTLAPDSSRLSFTKNRSQKTTLTVAVILVAILIFSVVFGLQKQKADREHAIFVKYYPESKAKIDEGKAIADLNPTLSRSLLLQGKDELQIAQKELKDKNSSDYKTISQLISQTDDLLTSISHVYKITSLDLFYDLGLIKDKAAGVRMGMYKNQLVILDSIGQAAYSLSLDTKAADIIAGGGQIKNSRYISIHGDKADIFSPDTGIVEVGLKDKSVKNIVKTDKNWGEIKDLVDFAGNIYLLDSRGQIIKYVATDTGYSDSKNYLRPDVTPDFSQSVGMAIDGSVWVLFKNGSITKFTQGRPDNFSISGLDTNFSSPLAIYTYDDAKNIYILDSGNNRIVVLDKTGNYAAQYQWQGISRVTDIVANEALGKLFLLAGSKIYSINLK